MAGKYDVNYNDKRLTDVTAEEKAALNAEDVRYGNMISESDKYYDNAINKYGVQDENGNWNEGSMAAIQTDLANKKTDQAIKEIEQDKEWAEKDYNKEQRAAYVDYMNQINPYGVEAEKRAAAGLSGALGYLQSVQARNFNTYQNRVAVAHEAFLKAVQGYDNAIADAKLQNSSVLAEIALNTFEQTTTLALQGLQYKNTLLQEQAAKKLQLKQYYSSEYQNVLTQLNREKEFAFQQDQAEIENKRQQALLEIAQGEYKIKQEQWAQEKADKEAARIEQQKAATAKKASAGHQRSRSTASQRGFGSSSKIQKSTTSKKATSVSTTPKGGQKQIDMDSVLKLGMGPISASKLNDLVSAGVVQEYVQGDKIKFKYTASGLKQKQLYSRLG